jgi:hypothetical protein
MKKLFFIFGIGITTFGIAQQFIGGPNNTTTAISRTGTIGVGTVTAPAAQLHVQTSGTTQLQVERAASGNQNNNLKVFFSSNPAVGITVGGGSTIFQAANPNAVSDMLFQQSPTATGMIIKSAGNVGIGDVNPLTKLFVRGDNIGLVRGTGIFGDPILTGTSQWLSLGVRPSSTIGFNSYGFRTQWDKNAADFALQERTAGLTRDAVVTWQDAKIT